ncbi:MAG: hypothetical protein PHQ43_08540 [Dehalococcoidales bacterium]|nr:hypothetical protein [Dehalococcoidales bacterium]
MDRPESDAMWGWDYTNQRWVKIAVDSSGILQVNDPPGDPEGEG